MLFSSFENVAYMYVHMNFPQCSMTWIVYTIFTMSNQVSFSGNCLLVSTDIYGAVYRGININV